MAQTLPLFRIAFSDGYACSVLYLGKQLTTCLSRVREKSYDDARVHTGVRGADNMGAVSAIAPSVF